MNTTNKWSQNRVMNKWALEQEEFGRDMGGPIEMGAACLAAPFA
jgi:hypothetical protein